MTEVAVVIMFFVVLVLITRLMGLTGILLGYRIAGSLALIAIALMAWLATGGGA